MASARTTLAALACALCMTALVSAPTGAAQTATGAARPASPAFAIVAEAPLRAPKPALRAAPSRAGALSPPRASDAAPSKVAALRAPRPAPRPARIAAKARDRDAGRPTASLQTAPASGARPRANAPRSVQAAATIPAAVAGDAPSLIGVFGGTDTRRALIRSPDGKLSTVRQGDRFGGWTVSAIGPDSVQLRDGARAQTLRIPGS